MTIQQLGFHIHYESVIAGDVVREYMSIEND